MKFTEIRGKDTKELRLDLADLRKELFQLRFKGGAEAVARPHRFREIKKTIARIETVFTQRERAQGGEVPSARATAQKQPKS